MSSRRSDSRAAGLQPASDATSLCSFPEYALDVLMEHHKGTTVQLQSPPHILHSAVNACREQQEVTAEQLASGLASLGYELPQSELAALMRQMDLRDEGRVGQPAFVASQLDWRAFQRNYK